MGKILGYQELIAALPRRCPGLLLDRVEVIDDRHLRGLKLVNSNEEFFIGHFPEHPIMPGVLQIEAMKQLCELVARPQLATAELSDIHLPLIEKVKFRRPVTPGDRLKIEAELLESSEGKMRFRAVASTKSGVASEGFLTLAARTPLVPPTIPQLFSEVDLGAETPLNAMKMMSMMPHRYPFLLIDYVQKIAETTVMAVKNVSGNDAIFRHFGTLAPTLPESLLCEMCAQAGAACVLSRPENEGKIGIFMTIDRAESFAPIVPGDQLAVDATLPPSNMKFGKGPCTVYVEGEKRFEINLMFGIIDA